ncbi:MAG: DUF1871 family protein [Saccharofermentanales bacterium]
MSFEKINEVIDDWDPIDLWHSHCPKDEYNDEIREIDKLIKDENDEHEIAEIIRNVFIASFNEDLFKFSIEDCLEIAKKI